VEKGERDNPTIPEFQRLWVAQIFGSRRIYRSLKKEGRNIDTHGVKRNALQLKCEEVATLMIYM